MNVYLKYAGETYELDPNDPYDGVGDIAIVNSTQNRDEVEDYLLEMLSKMTHVSLHLKEGKTFVGPTAELAFIIEE